MSNVFRKSGSAPIISLSKRRGYSLSGTPASSSSSHTVAWASEGARQSPRGDKEPPDEIFGPLGRAERLNWLNWKKRNRNTRSQRLISAKSKPRRAAAGVLAGHTPRSTSLHAFHDR